MLAAAFTGNCCAGPAGEPTDLSCTGLYADFATKTVATDVQPYTPGLVLWSDGATKNRWIYLPAGQKIDTSNMDEWTFPVGTKFYKEFSLAIGDASTPLRIETRMLWKCGTATTQPPGCPETGWYRTTYRWSNDGTTSATELDDGELNVDGTTYEIPTAGTTSSMCDKCHSGRSDGVMGFEAIAMSQSGAAGLTLAQLKMQDLLTAPPAAGFTIPGNEVESTALGMLHINCGVSCHSANANSAGVATGYWTRLNVAELSSVKATDAYTTGWGVSCVDYTFPGQANNPPRIDACNTANSASYYRMSVRDGVNGVPNGNQMPSIDTHQVDTTAVAQLGAWINEGCDGGKDASEQ